MFEEFTDKADLFLRVHCLHTILGEIAKFQKDDTLTEEQQRTILLSVTKSIWHHIKDLTINRLNIGEDVISSRPGTENMEDPGRVWELPEIENQAVIVARQIGYDWQTVFPLVPAGGQANIALKEK